MSRVVWGAFAVLMGLPSLLPQNLGSLKTITVPKPPGLERYVRDPDTLLVLGKALFWDMQLASDGRVACATCHFHAGSDHRPQNQLSNPLAPFPPNYTLALSDFPFHRLADASDNRSEILRDTSNRAGSAGVFRRMFLDVMPDGRSDDGFDASDAPAFSVAGINVRQVTGRKTPTAINAVFNFRNFWDGRANNVFTGRTPFGDSDISENVMAFRDGRVVPERVRLENSSLASQAVGPPVSTVEMSYEGRTWPKIGKRMLALRPLALQKVAPDDSVFAPYIGQDGRGLAARYTYLTLVQTAFQPEYWNAPEIAEFNFSLFFGLAIQAYESTLVSNDSRFDRFFEGSSDALTVQEQTGLQVFQRRGQCTTCHAGPELTMASYTSINRRGQVQRARNGPVSDTGFFRTGVRPLEEDIGLGGEDAFGKPLSIAAAQNPGARLATSGTFKTPTLRNVEFTGPFLHNGGQATLEQVVEFYNRGGDFPGGGTAGNGVRRLNLSPDERAALVAFMKALSDDRVRFERAPFDHPELCLPVGHAETFPSLLQAQTVDPRFPLSAADKWAAVPAIGRSGNSAPLQTFEELLQGIGADGTRSHTLADACTIP